jgi:hypothetical protein
MIFKKIRIQSFYFKIKQNGIKRENSKRNGKETIGKQLGEKKKREYLIGFGPTTHRASAGCAACPRGTAESGL